MTILSEADSHNPLWELKLIHFPNWRKLLRQLTNGTLSAERVYRAEIFSINNLYTFTRMKFCTRLMLITVKQLLKKRHLL